MKQLKHMFLSLGLVMLYTMLVSFAPQAGHTGEEHASTSTDKGQFTYVKAMSVAVHPSEGETAFESLTQVPGNTGEDTSTTQWAFVRPADILIENALRQYDGFAVNLLVNHRKTDLLFPFHNFW
ncbi:MAG: hypothetical protein CL868_20025 [Cytophagaceae bacterium]|nr:hypothetical protein [Cytophagaceae bacterium]|tara:strand:- start:2276 stop:2647 length:372 start_codon:yes stop_codon:yes gene_type:complete